MENEWNELDVCSWWFDKVVMHGKDIKKKNCVFYNALCEVWSSQRQNQKGAWLVENFQWQPLCVI